MPKNRVMKAIIIVVTINTVLVIASPVGAQSQSSPTPTSYPGSSSALPPFAPAYGNQDALAKRIEDQQKTIDDLKKQIDDLKTQQKTAQQKPAKKGFWQNYYQARQQALATRGPRPYMMPMMMQMPTPMCPPIIPSTPAMMPMPQLPSYHPMPMVPMSDPHPVQTVIDPMMQNFYQGAAFSNSRAPQLMLMQGY